MPQLETVQHIEPARLEDPGEAIGDVVARITGLPKRSARRVLSDVVLASHTPKGAVSLRFPIDALDVLFPRLFPET
jgi:hypothetical protein